MMGGSSDGAGTTNEAGLDDVARVEGILDTGA
jgi:hypothetical protein